MRDLIEILLRLGVPVILSLLAGAFSLGFWLFPYILYLETGRAEWFTAYIGHIFLSWAVLRLIANSNRS